MTLLWRRILMFTEHLCRHGKLLQQALQICNSSHNSPDKQFRETVLKNSPEKQSCETFLSASIGLCCF